MFSLIFFDDVLNKNKVSRGWSGEECKSRKTFLERRRGNSLDKRYNWRGVEHYRRLGYLHAYMRRDA
jgi:hypothetical protein